MTEVSVRRKRYPRILASPLRYPGGKTGLYWRLRNLIRNNDLAGCRYVEPYAGGAGSAAALLVTGQVDEIVVNDLDPAIHAFWDTVVRDPDYLMSRIETVALTVAEWRLQREIYLAGKDGSDTAVFGFATFYLNRTNRSGVLNGGPIGGLEQQGNYKIDARFNRKDLFERFRILALYADKISVSSGDGVEVIHKFAEQDGTFIYADPPYFEKAGTLYLNAFDNQDHQVLADALNDAADAKWLLTYDNVDDVARLYPERRRRAFEVNYSAHRVVRATEIAVVSDSLEDIGEGWPLWDPGDSSD